MKKALDPEQVKLNIWMGKRIKQIRLSLPTPMSQNQFGEHLGRTTMTLINWSKGRQTISSYDLFRISELFGCHVSQLFPVKDTNGNFVPQEAFGGEEPYLQIKSWEQIKAEGLDERANQY